MIVKKTRLLSPFLRMAVIAGVESAVQLHINRGDDLNARDSSGLTPLMLSATRNKVGICKLLLDAGVNDGMLDPSGRTAFDIAVAINAYEVISIFESAKNLAEYSSAWNQSSISEAREKYNSVVQIFSEPPITGYPTLSNDVVPPISIAEKKDPLYIEEVSEFDLQGWEPEEDKPPPVADVSAVKAATAIQQAITEYVPIDSSVDWDDVEAYLPETALPLERNGDAESRERLRLLLLRALREGSVPYMEVESLTANHDQTANPEAEILLSMVINDLGAEVDERFEYANTEENFLVFVKPEETSDEEEALSDALTCIEGLASRRNEPLRIYLKEFQQHPLISAEQEVFLAQAMENALEAALDALAKWPHGIKLILDAGRLVVTGKRPLNWISRSPSEASSDIDPALNNHIDEIESDGITSSSSGKSGDHVLNFSDALKRLAELPAATIQSEVGWSAVRAALSSLWLSRPFLLELAGTKDIQSPDMASEYAKAIKSYQCAREQMTVANLKLAFHISKKYLYSGEPLDDLAQEANIGLLKAVDRFDWRKGFKFSTYATWWIRQQISRSISDKCRTIRIPVHILDKVQQLQREVKDFELETGRMPALNEIAVRMNIPMHKVAALQNIAPEPLSIHDLPIDELIAVEVRSDFVSTDPMDIVFNSELHTLIDKMLASLEVKEEQVIRLRYGIGVKEILTLEEIGKRYEVTRERIRQIEAKALRELKRPNRLSEFLRSVHGREFSIDDHNNQTKLKRVHTDLATAVESIPDRSTPEAMLYLRNQTPKPSTEPSSIEIMFLQASALEAEIQLNHEKRLENIGKRRTIS